MGHAADSYLRDLQSLWKNNKDLLSVIFDDSILECEICVLTKLSKLPFRSKRKEASRQLQIIHSNVMGQVLKIKQSRNKK